MGKAIIASVVVGVIVIILGIILGWYVFPKVIDDNIIESVALNNDTDQFERFKTLPIPLDFKVYIFNIQNRKDANNGKKPIVEEKGPYIYKQTRNKENITWNEKKKISYYEFSNFEFDQEASGKLNNGDEITVLNPALNGALQIMELANLDFAINLLDSNLIKTVFGDKAEDIYITTTVEEFLFKGIDICDLDKINKLSDKNQKINALIVCLGLFVMPTKNIQPAEDDKLLFTFLSHKNNTHNGHFTVNSGIDNVKKLALIEKWEDSKFLTTWIGENSICNEVTGRDAVIFEPLQKDILPLTVFNTDICRTVDLHYVEDLTIRDVTAREYQLGEDTLNVGNDESSCYCLNITKGIQQENGCMEKGLLELFTCYNAPILLSFPHFLWADAKYKDSVDGLKSVVKNHKTYVHLEPNTGTPLGGSKRVQFNMFVRKIDSLVQSNILNGYETPRLIPILWLDEHFDITDDLYDILYDSYVSKLVIIDGVTWGIIALGIVIALVTLGIHIWKQKKSSKQTV